MPVRLLIVVLLTVLAAASPAAAAPSPDVVIAQVYGGGGSSSATTYCQDYVELFNRSTTGTTDVGGWSIQYGSANGNFGASTSAIIPLPAGTSIAAGKAFLVPTGNTTTGACTPVPGDTPAGTANLAAASGKVALSTSSTALGCGGTGNLCSAATPVRDLVGYGTVSQAETAATGALSTTTAAIRDAGGCDDTDDNSADFTVTSPAPRTSSAAAAVCGGGGGTPAQTVAFSAASFTVGEAGPKATITVTRSGATTGTITVDHATSDGTATAGSDYTSAGGTLTFGDGDSSETFDVAVTQDAIDEPDETVTLRLSNPTGGAGLGSPDTSTLTITDDDAAPPSGVVLSDVRLQGPDLDSSPNGRDDEYVELRNTSANEVVLSGWRLQACNGSGGTFPLITFRDGTRIPAGATFVAASGAAGDTTKDRADVLWPGSSFIASTGGVRLVDAALGHQDGVGHTSGTNNLCREPKQSGGVAFPPDTDNTGPYAFERKAGGTQDTDDNAADFLGPVAGSPVRCGAPCAAPDVPPALLRISEIQGSGQSSPRNGQEVLVEGVVTGIDAEVGANFSRTFPEDAGVYVQEEATADPATDDDANPATSEGIFVGFVDSPSPSLVGKRVRVRGFVEEKFGQTIISEAGSGDADLTEPTVLGDGPAIAPTTIVEATADAQSVTTRPYYESLENMLVTVATATANSGGTNKFGELFLTLGTEQDRVFRGESPPDLLAAADDAGSGNQPNPYTAGRSSTFVPADLFDRVSGLTGPLGFSFGHFKLVNQTQPTVVDGPTPYPYTVPEPAKRDVRVLSFNVENVFPVGGSVDLHTVTPSEYTAKLDGIVFAIDDRLRRPDVIALQEIVDQSVADDLAGELGGYTAHLVEGNDERGIDVAYLIRNTMKSVSVKQLGKDAPAPAELGTACADAVNPKLFDRPPLRADVDAGGGLRFTVINNHFASKGNPDGCRDAQGSYVRDRVAELEAEGREVIVTGDLNSFEDEIALQRLEDDSTTLDNLWDTAPEQERYSFQFDGRLQTLDHTLVTDGLVPLVKDFRYPHIDNDYFKRVAPQDGHGASDHDPVLLTLEKGEEEKPGRDEDEDEDEDGKDKDEDEVKDKAADRSTGATSTAAGAAGSAASTSAPPAGAPGTPRAAGFRGRGTNVAASSLRLSGRTLVLGLLNRNGFAVRATVRAETAGRTRSRAAATLGRATVRLAAGASRRVRLRLGRAALARLRRGARVRLVLTLTDPAGVRRTVRVTPALRR